MMPFIGAPVRVIAARPSPTRLIGDAEVQLPRSAVLQLSAHRGSVLKISSYLGNQAYVRLLDVASADEPGALARIGRQLWTQLQIKPGEQIEVQPVPDPPEAAAVRLRPAFHLSHNLGHRFIDSVRADRAIVWPGMQLFAPIFSGGGGVLVRVEAVDAVPGVIGEGTALEFDEPDPDLGRRRITLAEIGGLDAEINRIRDLVELPLLRPGMYRSLGVRPPKGVLLHGPPGTGKTMLSRAVAAELRVHIRKLPATELVGTYSGETEANLRRLFDEASHHAPTLIVIDEIDVITTNRGRLASQGDIRATTQLLSLMDGLDEVDGVVLLATTNRVDVVDEAFRRPGRFDEEIYVGPPGASARREILAIHTREMPLTADAEEVLEELAGTPTSGFTGADLMHLVREAGLAAARRISGATAGFEIADQLAGAGFSVTDADLKEAIGNVSPSAMRGLPTIDSHLLWDEIDGVDDVKAALLEAAESTLADNATVRDGVLLTGPSGNGKSLLLQALAAEIGANYVLVDGSTVYTQWLGESEAAVRTLFGKARDVQPALVVIEHLDAIAPRRSADVTEAAAGRVLSALLSSVDEALRHGGILVVGVTDRAELIDPALSRAGRLGVHLEVPLPDGVRRRRIVERVAAGALGPAAIDVLVDTTAGNSAADVERRAMREVRAMILHA
jgi:transitional endoplasmic reticulum ATPase